MLSHGAVPVGGTTDPEKALGVRPRRLAETPASVARPRASVAPSGHITWIQDGTSSDRTPVLKKLVQCRIKGQTGVPNLARIQRQKWKDPAATLHYALPPTVSADPLRLYRSRRIIPRTIERVC